MKTLNLGNVPILPANVVNYKVPIPSANAQIAPGEGKFLNALNNIFTNVSNTVQNVAPIVSNVKSTVETIKNKGGTNKGGMNTANMTYNPNTGIYEQPKRGLSTGVKIGIGVAAAGTLGLLIYAFTGKKKKVK